MDRRSTARHVEATKFWSRALGLSKRLRLRAEEAAVSVHCAHVCSLMQPVLPLQRSSSSREVFGTFVVAPCYLFLLHT